MKAIRKYIRISPKKVNIVAGMVRGRKVTDALVDLELLNKKSALELHKAIKSAASNAVHNFSQDMNSLKIKSLLVTPGPTLKRVKAASKGRAKRILKRTSHIVVEVSV